MLWALSAHPLHCPSPPELKAQQQHHEAKPPWGARCPDVWGPSGHHQRAGTVLSPGAHEQPGCVESRNFDTYLGSGVVWLMKSNGKIKLAFEIL